MKMVKCPKCETEMVDFHELRSRRIPNSTEVEKILVTGKKCLNCGSKRPKEKTLLQKEKPIESSKITVYFPPEIHSK